MLVAKIYINKRQIDEVHVQNIGVANPGTYDNVWRYKIRKPEGFDNVILHHRVDGYGPLLIKVLEILKGKK